MIELRRAVQTVRVLALALLLTACGSNSDSRPIEVLFYVDGLSGTQFTVDGIQAANANHQLCLDPQQTNCENGPKHPFEAPYFFVLENARQFPAPGAGIRGCFRTDKVTTTSPITIFLFYGTGLQERVVLQPGQCYVSGKDPVECPTSNLCKDATPPPMVTGPEVRFEICTDTGTGPCVTSPPTGPANVAFTASTGDFDSTNITSCVIPEATVSFCTTPSIFYLEDPVDGLQGIFTKLSLQNPDVRLKADLYIDGTLRTTQSSKGDVIIDEQL